MCHDSGIHTQIPAVCDRSCCGTVNIFFFRATDGVPPRELYDTPEREKQYPEPSMFGLMPVWGFFIRHTNGVQVDHVELSSRSKTSARRS
jgi:hypothetical protein